MTEDDLNTIPRKPHNWEPAHNVYATLMIPLGAAEHLAMADLIDRVDTTPGLIGSGDMHSNSHDRAFTGGDAFFVVFGAEKKLHHYHVSAYGEVYYIGTSPLIPRPLG